MTDVTLILSQIEQGDPSVAEQLLPLVYGELRKLAQAKLAREKPGQTLQATALVHEAYLRLVDVEQAQHWDSRRHFFAAAAEAMRRILVERARRRRRQKHGGRLVRKDITPLQAPGFESWDTLLDVHEALGKLESAHADAAQIVKLRFFAGFTNRESADMLGISPRKANQLWAYARAWLLDSLSEEGTV